MGLTLRDPYVKGEVVIPNGSQVPATHVTMPDGYVDLLVFVPAMNAQLGFDASFNGSTWFELQMVNADGTVEKVITDTDDGNLMLNLTPYMNGAKFWRPNTTVNQAAERTLTYQHRS